MRVQLSGATTRLDHTRDLVTGDVRVEGADVIWLQHEAEDLIHRFYTHREWDISEMSMALYTAARGAGDDSITAIPVFLCRMFRHSSIYVAASSPLSSPSELAGKRVGIPQWTQTAGVYLRGLLESDYGVDLTSVDWVQAGVNEPGRQEHTALSLPAGIRYTSVPSQTLNDMLQDGSIDAVLSARPPVDSAGPAPRIRRLIPDFEAAERDYYARTRIFPVMHTVAIRTELLDRYPWLARNVFSAFELARDRSVERIADIGASPLPVPWSRRHALDAWAAMDPADPWPYGIERNRPTLEAFLGYCHRQGVTPNLLSPEEIFARQVDIGMRV
jgi:4,5-dihydroxyphthalate decarboxylase